MNLRSNDFENDMINSTLADQTMMWRADVAMKLDVPIKWLWRLEKISNCRILQRSVPESPSLKILMRLLACCSTTSNMYEILS
jgi:hypothetical protein